MDLQHLRVLVALAEEGTMIRAAERLSITQPAISFALAQFERELGFALFHRSTRGLTLTTRAIEVLDKARSVLRTSEEISQLGSATEADRGAVRVAGRAGFMQYVFPLVMKSLRDELPNIEITAAISGSSEAVVSQLRTGQVDLAFAASPNIKSITAELIFHDPVWIAVSRSHPLAKKKRVSVRDLHSVSFCVPVPSDRLRSPIDRFLKKVSPKPEIAIETNDYTVMKNLLRSGEYAGFVYAHTLLSKDAADLRPLLIKEFSLARDLTILHRRDDLLPHVARTREVLIRVSKRLLEENVKRIERMLS